MGHNDLVIAKAKNYRQEHLDRFDRLTVAYERAMRNVMNTELGTREHARSIHSLWLIADRLRTSKLMADRLEERISNLELTNVEPVNA